jgi:hypothetical protein
VSVYPISLSAECGRGNAMIKRVSSASKVSKPEPELEESTFKVGSLVGVYILGQRYGYIKDLELDDDGDLVAHMDIKGVKSRKKLWFKTKDLTLEG